MQEIKIWYTVLVRSKCRWL